MSGSCLDCGVILGLSTAYRNCRSRCKTCQKRKARAWASRHPEKSRAQGRKTRAKLKAEVIEAYGSKCACCGESEPAFLSLDHIYNDGKQERARLAAAGKDFYSYLRAENYPKGRLQVLCYNCNHAKSQRNGCPHIVREMGEG